MNVLDLFVQKGGYSENTYTPVLSASGGTIPTFTAVPLTGRYFKVGRLVTVRMAASNTAGGTPGAGSFQLSISLPLPVAANAIGGRTMAGAWTNSTTEGIAFAQGGAGAMTAQLYNLGSTSNQVALNCGDFTNVNRAINFMFTYPTD